MGRVYGTRVPEAYYERLRRDPRAFRFERGFLGLLRPELRAPGAAVEAVEGAAVGAAATLRATVRIPVVLGLYKDADAVPPVTRADVQRDFFDGPNRYYGTLTEYYREVSGGALTVGGDVFDWVRVSLTRAQVVGSSKGLGNDAQVGRFIVEILRFLTDSVRVDWRRYDADGDGYVDVLGVMHPDKDGACTPPGTVAIWSHRYALRRSFGTSFVATTPTGDTIRINDYVVVPAVSCSFGQEQRGFLRTVNEIGVFAHELGHGFGLPDLYDTRQGSKIAGVGNWDLMATGSWGCSVFEPERPCHMGAWSKAQLGWVTLDTLAGGRDHGAVGLAPVVSSGRALYVAAGDGSNEHFLLENRQKLGFDGNLFAPGVLIWHIDEDVVRQRWQSNKINNDPHRMGVALEQADGLEQLARSLDQGGNWGDGGDPFPGLTGNTAFHAGTRPSSFSNQGRASGVTVLDLGLVGESAGFRLLTRFQNLRIVVEGASGATVTVGGTAVPAAPQADFRLAPFQSDTVEAAPGVVVGPGVRNGFIGWADGAPRIRAFTMGLADTTLTARYGRTEYLLDLKVESPVPGVVPGKLTVTPEAPEGWMAPGTDVTVLASPVTGFAFSEWTGDLTGAPNPVTVRLDAPRTAAARFRQIFGVAATDPVVAFDAAVPQEIAFRAENGNAPVRWVLAGGRLPEGLTLRADGRVTGAALETGTFPMTVQAVDAIGLEATAEVTFQVRVPQIAGPVLAGPFLLNGRSPDQIQQVYLDRLGNRNGRYDLPDLRAYVVVNPNLPDAAVVQAVAGPSPVVVPLVDFSRVRP